MNVTRGETTVGRVQPNTRERIIIQVIHWGVVLVVVIATTLLAIDGRLDKASTTALFGTVLGHVGTSAATKLQARGRTGDGD